MTNQTEELRLNDGDNAWRQGHMTEAAGHWQRVTSVDHEPSLRVRAFCRLAVIGLIEGDRDRSMLLLYAFKVCREAGLHRNWIRNAVGGLFVAPFQQEPFDALLRGLERRASRLEDEPELAADYRWLSDELKKTLPVAEAAS